MQIAWTCIVGLVVGQTFSQNTEVALKQNAPLGPLNIGEEHMALLTAPFGKHHLCDEQCSYTHYLSWVHTTIVHLNYISTNHNNSTLYLYFLGLTTFIWRCRLISDPDSLQSAYDCSLQGRAFIIHWFQIFCYIFLII